MSLLHYVFVAAVLPALVVVPGYAALGRAQVDAVARWTFAPGITVLAVAGLSAVAIPLGISGRVASYVVVSISAVTTAIVAVSALRRLRGGVRHLLRRPEVPLLAIFIGAFAFLTGFNLMTSNPPGSIDPCAPVSEKSPPFNPAPQPGVTCGVFSPASLTMSRLPNRSIDDLLQFRTTQAIWNRHLYGVSDFAGGWRLQDRTPLLGLTVAGFASAGGVSFPVGYPPQIAFPQFGKPGPLWLKRWGAPTDSSITPETQPQAFVFPGYRPPLIDSWGYWFYRLLTIFLGTLVVLPTYALATRLGGPRVGALAAVAAAAAPAVMQNAYYTSPKYLGLYFGLCALVLVVMRRAAAAGVALAAAYLCHPFMAILGGPIVIYAARRSVRGAFATAVVAAVLVLPWLVFTHATGHSSSLLTHPLGCDGPTATLRACWHQFVAQPKSSILWQRLVIVPQMVLPFGIDASIQPPGWIGLVVKWLTIHDFAFPGMVGLVFFALVVVGIVRGWARHRQLFLWLVAGQTAVIVVISGTPGAAAWVAGLGLLPFAFYFGAVGVASLSPHKARWVAVLVAAEWLSYIAALYWPIDGISVAQYVIGWILVAAGLLCVLGIAYAAITRRLLVETTLRSEAPDSPLVQDAVVGISR